MKKLSPNAIKNITPPVLANPVGIDAAVKGLQSAVGSLTWLDKSFARAVVASNKSDEGTYIFPAIDVPNNDPLDMLALDNWKSYSFFLARDTETRLTPGYDKAYQRTLNLIVWVNLNQVSVTREKLKQDILGKMVVSPDTGHKVLDIEITNVYDEISSVFNGFTIDLAESQLASYPYWAFRVEAACVYVVED